MTLHFKNKNCKACLPLLDIHHHIAALVDQLFLAKKQSLAHTSPSQSANLETFSTWIQAKQVQPSGQQVHLNV